MRARRRPATADPYLDRVCQTTSCVRITDLEASSPDDFTFCSRVPHIRQDPGASTLSRPHRSGGLRSRSLKPCNLERNPIFWHVVVACRRLLCKCFRHCVSVSALHHQHSVDGSSQPRTREPASTQAM